jgi:hypothetical protein
MEKKFTDEIARTSIILYLYCIERLYPAKNKIFKVSKHRECKILATPKQKL